jgi:hypothetical protein
MEILNQIAWNFTNTDYISIDEFNKDIKEYQDTIMGDEAYWNPEDVVVDSPEVHVFYEYWETGEDPVFEDEKDVTESIESDEEYDEPDQKEVIVTFKADNGTNFTALELMYKLHQRLRQRDLGDHTFFEGLSLEEDEEVQPLFYLNCGS